MLRYTPGKMDWFASGLPREGREAGRPRTLDAARRDVPTCRPHEQLGEVARRVRAAGWDVCVVVDAGGVVLGLLAPAALDGDAAALAQDVMQAAPKTLRPHLPLEDVLDSLRQRKGERALVTTSDGRLQGLLRAADAEARLGGSTGAGPRAA